MFGMLFLDARTMCPRTICAPKRKVSDVPSLGHVVPDLCVVSLTLDCIEVTVKISLMYA
jgi:hypothetical protein